MRRRWDLPDVVELVLACGFLAVTLGFIAVLVIGVLSL